MYLKEKKFWRMNCIVISYSYRFKNMYADFRSDINFILDVKIIIKKKVALLIKYIKLK